MFNDKATNGKKTKVDEANTIMTFTVSLKGVLKDDESLSVAFQTANGTAMADADYGNNHKIVEFVNAVTNNFTTTCKKVA
jgi:hypothetical protein